MTDFLISNIQAHSALGLLCLFAIFFYVGLITIGGGLVAITILQQSLVENFHLIDQATFYNMVAVSESTPGPIGINIATYIGTNLYGPGGGIITTLGEVAPSIICILIIGKFFNKFADRKGVKAAFSTLKPAVTGVIAIAAVKIILLSLFVTVGTVSPTQISTWNNIHLAGPSTIFYAICLVLLFKTKVHPVFIILAGAVFGIIFC
jgi:chromate transporter